MAVPVAAIMKGVQIAGQVKDVADTVNTASQVMNVNQDSIFAKREEEGNGGAINSVFQAADTLTGGSVGKVAEEVDKNTGGMAGTALQAADKIVTPVMEAIDMTDGPDVGDGAKILKKMPDIKA